MHMQPAKVPAKLLLPLHTNVLEVLAPEHHDAPFGNQQRELVLLLVRQLGELEAGDLGADAGGQLRDLDVGVVQPEDMRLGFVGEETAVGELEGLGGWECGGFVVDREVVRVLVLFLPFSFLLPNP